MKPSATSGINKKSQSVKIADIPEVLSRLKRFFPNAHCELVHQGPFQLLVATVLSAQCTDEMVNRVTPTLFKKFPGPRALADSDLQDVEDCIKSLGLFRHKAKNIRALSQTIIDKYHGQVPQRMEDLISLAGVGRKTANVVLGNAFGVASGIVVDTHVARLSYRFGWVKEEDPIKIEKTLCQLIPQQDWVQVSHELIFLGRRICKARSPDCENCFLLDICPRRGVK